MAIHEIHGDRWFDEAIVAPHPTYARSSELGPVHQRRAMTLPGSWFVALVVLSLVVAACGDGEGGGSLGEQPLQVSVPATLTGVLDVSVEEGPVGQDDLSEINFGSLELDDGFVLIEISASTARAAGVTRDELVGGGSFRIELSGEGEYFDPRAPTYVVSGIESLD